MMIHAQALDLSSNFDASAESWRTNGGSATLTWQATGGTTAGFLQGVGTGSMWQFVSPISWSGDWSAYRTLKFDLAIPSRHYADNDSAGMVVIVGANSNTMNWTGATPLWTWTHYDVSLDPASFGVDQATFDGIMANVAEVRILAEFNATANETVGLDNVLLTATPVTIHGADLVERFTNAVTVPGNASLNGWTRVDDVDLFANATDGRPLYSLYCDDWQDGRTFSIASPLDWAGDWRGFTEIRFDLKWTSSGSIAGENLLRIFGANGQQLVWSTTLVKGAWQRIVIPLTPEAFGVDAATFHDVMAFVSKISIRGEYDNGNDQLWLDNITVATAPETPRILGSSLVSRFGAGNEGWNAFDAATLGWDAAGGFSGGAITCTDAGSGTARFSSPDTWSGNWSSFSRLRFMLRTRSGKATLIPIVSIVGFNGTLTTSPPLPYDSWSPYTLDLTPAAFGVTQQQFDEVMGNVAHLTIVGDLVNGTDTTALDDVSLTADTTPGAPPDRFAQFDADIEGWRKGGINGTTWGILAAAPEYRNDGNPGGCIAANDDTGLTYWLSPESWAGDWRGNESISFDLKILSGTSLLVPDNMLSIISVHGILQQTVPQAPSLNIWNHYEFALTPAAFGVTQQVFDTIMQDVVMVGIRSEWINGAEKEALDNVRLSKAPEAYWLWLSNYLDATELGDESLAGKLADYDGDAQNNYAEFLSLTDPINPLSRFSALGRKVGSTFEVEYSSKAGRVYQIWKSATLANDWERVGPQMPGDNTFKVYSHPIAEPAEFFRVEVDLP